MRYSTDRDTKLYSFSIWEIVNESAWTLTNLRHNFMQNFPTKFKENKLKVFDNGLIVAVDSIRFGLFQF